MSRPRKADDPDLVSISTRIPRELHEQLRAEADARMLSINWIVLRAIEDFVPRLIPVEEFRLTRLREDPPT